MKIGKTWIEANVDGSLDKMKGEQVRELIGYVTPINKDNWDVTMIDGGFTCKTQEHAEIIAQNEMILAIMLRNLARR